MLEVGTGCWSHKRLIDALEVGGACWKLLGVVGDCCRLVEFDGGY